MRKSLHLRRRRWEGGRKRGRIFEVTLTPLDSRMYCVTDIDPDHRKLSQLEAMVRFLTGEDPDLECACCLPMRASFWDPAAQDFAGGEGWG